MCTMDVSAESKAIRHPDSALLKAGLDAGPKLVSAKRLVGVAPAMAKKSWTCGLEDEAHREDSLAGGCLARTTIYF